MPLEHAVAGLVDVSPVDIPLGGIPVWIVGVPDVDEPTWVVAREDGIVEAWRLGASGPEQVPIDVPPLPRGTPPVVNLTPDGINVVSPPADASTLTYPVGVSGRLMYVDTSGSLVIVDGSEATIADSGGGSFGASAPLSDGLGLGEGR